MDNPKNMTQIHARNKAQTVLSGTSLQKLPCLDETGRAPKKVRHTTKLSQYESRNGYIHLTPNQRQPPKKKRSVAFYVHCFQKKTTKIAKIIQKSRRNHCSPDLLISKNTPKQAFRLLQHVGQIHLEETSKPQQLQQATILNHAQPLVGH